MIKCLLLIFGSRSGRTDLESNIFPSGPPTQTISTYYFIYACSYWWNTPHVVKYEGCVLSLNMEL